MPTLALHFPWRRYHATPWGGYVNEGAVELPPSPWRLLRSLYAVWRMRRPDLDEAAVHEALRALAVPPDYLLPPYRLGHTRHYYPDTKRRSGTDGATDKAIDAFAVLGGDATLYARWPGELPAPQAAALAALAASLPYLGRADSLCDARVLPGVPAETADTHALASPLDLDAAVPPGHTGTGLLAATLPLDVGALTARPVEVRADKLRYPPGSRFVGYAIPDTPPAPARAPRRRRAETAPTVVRFALHAAAPPPRAQAVTLAEVFRATCVSVLGAVRAEHADSLLTGKNTAGDPLTGHRHAHFLPVADRAGRITELVVWTPGGLAADEMDALARLADRRIGTPDGVRGPKHVQARISAYGDAAILPAELRGPARTWTTATPLVPNRHRKREDTDAFLTGLVTRELGYRDLPEPIRVERIGGDWTRFTRHRSLGRHGLAESRPGHGFRLEFAAPVTGPIALGALSHFGLGLFHPEVTR